MEDWTHYTLLLLSDAVPPVKAYDLVAYLVLQTSFITNKLFKARKLLEAYNQFVSGWIKEVKVWDITASRKFVVKGRVSWLACMRVSVKVSCFGAGMASQKFTEVPLHCWIIVDFNGEVCCAHCNCMAKVCTHVAAVLFYLEAIYRM